MSNLDDQLNRLLKAGAKGGRGAESAPSPWLASRVLAEARAPRRESADVAFSALCNRAILWSCCVAALAFLLNIRALESFRKLDAWRSSDIRLIDSAMQLDIP